MVKWRELKDRRRPRFLRLRRAYRRGKEKGRVTSARRCQRVRGTAGSRARSAQRHAAWRRVKTASPMAMPRLASRRNGKWKEEQEWERRQVVRRGRLALPLRPSRRPRALVTASVWTRQHRQRRWQRRQDPLLAAAGFQPTSDRRRWVGDAWPPRLRRRATSVLALTLLLGKVAGRGRAVRPPPGLYGVEPRETTGLSVGRARARGGKGAVLGPA